MNHNQSVSQSNGHCQHTSLCLNISCMLMPSVLRTVSFSPVFVVVSLSRQRVKPLVSMMTAFWASVDRTEVRSKCTLLTGKTNSTYERGDRRWIKGSRYIEKGEEKKKRKSKILNTSESFSLDGLKSAYSRLLTRGYCMRSSVM